MGIVLKSANPLSDAEFVLIADQFAAELAAASGPIDRRAVQKAIDLVDVDWAVLTPGQRGAIIGEASRALGLPGPAVTRATSATVRTQLKGIVQGTKIAVQDQINFKLRAGFSQIDRRTVNNVMNSHAFFVTNEYGRHARAFSRHGRDIVTTGLASGLRSAEIANDLQAAARKVGLKQTQNYWQVTAYAASNRARTLTQLQSYTSAGVSHYTFSATMDRRTTEICRMMDGRVFSVADSLNGYDEVQNDPRFDAVKDHQPWVRKRKIPDTDESELFIKQRDGSEVRIARVVQPGIGAPDRKGKYANTMDSATMAQFGIIQPPLHGMCRSQIVPVV